MTERTKLTAGRLDLAGMAWRKSTFSGPKEDCVEVAPTPNIIAVRDSEHPAGPVLTFTAAEWAAFLSGVRAGEFDL